MGAVIISFVSANVDDLILGLPRRPRIADASASTIFWAIAGGLIAGPAGLLLGGVTGNALANQRQPLEMAVREYLSRQGLETIFFYPGPRSMKVTFKDGRNRYWTVESAMPDNLTLPPEDTLDWLYGNFITYKLPYVLHRLRNVS